MIKEILSSAEAFWSLYGVSILAIITCLAAVIKNAISVRKFFKSNDKEYEKLKSQIDEIRENQSYIAQNITEIKESTTRIRGKKNEK